MDRSPYEPNPDLDLRFDLPAHCRQCGAMMLYIECGNPHGFDSATGLREPGWRVVCSMKPRGFWRIIYWFKLSTHDEYWAPMKIYKTPGQYAHNRVAPPPPPPDMVEL
jgi:hypothetical protein